MPAIYFTSYRPFLRDQTNRPNPPLQPASKLQHVDGNKKDVLGHKGKGDGEVGAKPKWRAGHAVQKSSSTSQRAAVAHPEQPRKGANLPVSHPARNRVRLPSANCGHLNPDRTKKPAQEPDPTAAPPTGRDPPSPGAACSPNEGLEDRLVCNKENDRAQAFAHILAHRQSSAPKPRAVAGPKGRMNSCQLKEEPLEDKFRKTLLVSKSTSQNPSSKTQPLQPPQPLTASAHGKASPKGRQPPEKPLRCTFPVGSREHQSRPPQIKRSPTKPLASGRPQGSTNLKPGGTVPWQESLPKGGVDRGGMKVMPPRGAAASQVTVPQNQPCSTQGSKTQATEGNFRKREYLKPELPKASGIQARCVPKSLSAADRRKQLEEWLASKGKMYKRPPMMLLQKKAVKLPCRNVKEKEKQDKLEEEHCLEKINHVLTECLKLIEEGVETEEVLEVLSHVPQAEKFAKFWICKAKLLTRSGPFDVTGLYRAAVCAGAAPLQELREVILNILKTADQIPEGEKPQPGPEEPTSPSKRQHMAVTPCLPGRSLSSLPASIKLQVTSVPRVKELPQGPELKFLTPVRRSVRIERVGSSYPALLKDHDPVVSSLSEILDAEEETQFFFRKNKALPEVTELEGLSSYPPDSC
ncbi:cytoskeleton-associated protein 2-like [Neopsephotus bourkii]|uniref:cytoskeleton-associated protein 2-like n=1 Tax=Neopsephotus bourkii TaxID=309878 RepID=UPI002AA56FE8|nr:cytoskeleton-associated protein 2-like [Neopsephotus bourkii]